MSMMQGHVNTVTENDSTTNIDIDKILDTHTNFQRYGEDQRYTEKQ